VKVMDLMSILKALADETRLRILNILKYGELCVCEIEILLDINQSNASRHLNKLTNAKIVEYYKKAQYVYYKFNEETLKEFGFINEIIKNDTVKMEKCNRDIARLQEYKKSDITCDDLKCGKLTFKK
jgi:ArsR family transcriptional regulator, arsenate/arsenite/antimonite-responsive transcriptional repressor